MPEGSITLRAGLCLEYLLEAGYLRVSGSILDENKELSLVKHSKSSNIKTLREQKTWLETVAETATLPLPPELRLKTFIRN